MQPDPITIAVDVLNNGTTENQVYERVREEGLKSIYHGPGHSASMRNTLTFIANDPKPSGNYTGVQKSVVKFTEDVSGPGVNGLDVIQPLIATFEVSRPAIATDAQVLEIRQRLHALIDSDAIMVPLNSRGVY